MPSCSQHVWGDELAEVGDRRRTDARHRPVGRDGRRVPAVRRNVGSASSSITSSPDRRRQRIARQVAGPDVLVTGHPFVDVWAGVRPQVMIIAEWPDVPRSVEWKQGLCDALGVSITDFWPHLRNRVRTFADLRPELVGAVEQLIDFVALRHQLTTTTAERDHNRRTDRQDHKERRGVADEDQDRGEHLDETVPTAPERLADRRLLGRLRLSGCGGWFGV